MKDIKQIVKSKDNGIPKISLYENDGTSNIPCEYSSTDCLVVSIDEYGRVEILKKIPKRIYKLDKKLDKYMWLSLDNGYLFPYEVGSICPNLCQKMFCSICTNHGFRTVTLAVENRLNSSSNMGVFILHKPTYSEIHELLTEVCGILD